MLSLKNFHFDIAERTVSPVPAKSLAESLLPEILNANPNFSQDLLDSLILVLGNCAFLARWARRFPEKVIFLLNQDIVQNSSLQDYQRRLDQHILQEKKQNQFELGQSLVDFKYTELFKICLRDFGLKTDFAIIAAEISYLAQSIVQKALEETQSKLNSEWGKVINPKTQQEIQYCIMGMGKLGGHELNFSSDIDLIPYYASDQVIKSQENPKTSFTSHEYFTKLTQELHQLLSKKQGGGFLYRVDLELRPEGKSGALVNSIDAMETYYESFGAPWEKQAMIRADFLAGSKELFQEFMKRIHPFVYPKIADLSFLKELKEMKNKIHQSINISNAQGFHIKLGEGGIREVEFFVQSFQLLFGGKFPDLQCTNTLDTLEKMLKLKFVQTEEYNRIKAAYIFLRTVENRLQQAEEQQIHRLPENQEELFQLAYRMGYFSKDPKIALKLFLQDLEHHRLFVEKIFKSLFDPNFGAAHL